MFLNRLASSAAPTLRQCLRLAWPALLLGVILRFSYFVAIPEPMVTPDTNSYLGTAFDLWEKREFSMAAKRRWIYPALVTVVPILPGSIAQGVTAVQHAIGLGAIVAMAWIVGQLTRCWRLTIPLATMVFAVWPPLLTLEHTFIAESLFISAFIFTVALALPVQRLRTPHRLLAFLLALTFTVGLRPPGRAVWLGAAVLLVLVARERRLWNWKNIAAAALCTVTAFTAGSDRLGARLLLSSVLPLVDTAGASHRHYRQALEPMIVDARQHGATYPWYQAQYKTRLDHPDEPMVGEAWRQLARDDREFERVSKALGIETVLRHPWTFARFTFTKILIASATPVSTVQSAGVPLEFDPARFWQFQEADLRDQWEKKGARLSWIYGDLARSQWEELAAERATRTFWFGPFAGWLNSALPWSVLFPGVGTVGVVKISWLGWLALAGLAVCLWPSRFISSLMLWLPMLTYLGLTLGVGDRLPRFCVPVHWCWICLAVIAIDAVLVVVLRLVKRGTE